MIAGVTRALRRRRLDQPDRRLLRHDARPHRRARGDGRGQDAAPAATAYARTLGSGLEMVGAGRGQPSAPGGRTHELPRVSRKFKRLIAEDKFEEASEIARRQVQGRRAGHRHLPRRTPTGTSSRTLRGVPRAHVIRKVKVPLMIDSTDAAVIAELAHLLPGQGDHQLRQPGRRPGALRERRAARAEVRRGARRRLHRRGQGVRAWR